VVGAGQGGLLLRRIVQRLDDLETLGCEVVDHGNGVLGSDDEYAFNHQKASAAARCPLSSPGSRPGSVRPQPHSAESPKSSMNFLATAMRALSPAASSWCSRPRYSSVPAGRRPFFSGAWYGASVRSFATGIW